MQPTIATFSGATFDFLNPEGSAFALLDIAQGLANTARFAGQTGSFYSVAQHSVLVSHEVAPALALQGLFHDAAEAFLGDVPTPLKQLLPDYRRLEKQAERSILRRLGLPDTLDPAVKRADLVLLATEKRDLMGGHDRDRPWGILDGIAPREARIVPLAPLEARALFLERVVALMGAEAVALVFAPELEVAA